MPYMSRIRVNRSLVFTVVLTLALLVTAIVLKQFFDARASAREQAMLREAARFIGDKAIERAADTPRFIPLTTEEQRAFESRFRDRSNAPIIYDPWTPQGVPIVQSESNHSDIVAYSVTLTPQGDRAIVTAALGVYYVPDTEINWPERQWAGNP